MATLAIVTGASKGLGRAISITVASRFKHVHLVLISRDKEGLEITQTQVHEVAKSRVNNVTTSLHILDFSDLDKLPVEFETILKEATPVHEYSRIIYFCNHGTLGALKPIKNQTDYGAIRKDIDTTVTSVFISVSVFLKFFDAKNVPIVLVNISTLAAVKAVSCWGIYCSARAARDMIFRCVAEEVPESKNIKTLNYAPGPCDTDMQKIVRETDEGPARQFYVDLHAQGKLIDPHVTVNKLIDILEKNTFTSGDHIDFYDC